MVPGPPPRAGACLARRRSRGAQGGREALRSRCARARQKTRSLPEPVRALPADGDAGRRMNIRRATTADEATLRELVDEFGVEIPEPGDVGPQSWEEEWS